MNRNEVENVLLKMGIPAGIKGFKYIADAIMILDDPEWDPKGAITLYNRIAEMNNTTGSRAEREIRHAFETARDPKGNYDVVEHYIGFMNCENYSSIKMLHIRIKQECEDREKILKKQEKSEYLRGIGENDIRQIVREELNVIIGEAYEHGIRKQIIHY